MKQLIYIFIFLPLLSLSQDCTVCGGDPVNLFASTSGGTAPLIHSWVCTDGFTSSLESPTFTPSADVTCEYIVVDALACRDTQELIVDVCPTLTATTSNTQNTACNSPYNGTATVNPSGGCSSGYSYTWNTSPTQTTQTATGLNAGTYSVTITTNQNGVNCDLVETVTVTNNLPSTVVNITGPTSGNCGDAGITLDAGAGFDTYMWSNGATTQTTTIDPSCPSVTSASVTVTDQCGTDTDTHPISICNSGSVSIDDVFYQGAGAQCIFLAAVSSCCDNPEWQWVDPCGSIVSTVASLSNGGPFGNQITVCGTYTLNLISCNGCTECTGTATYDIVMNGGAGGLNCCGGTCGCTSCTANINGGTVSTTCNMLASYTASTCTGATLTWTAELGATLIASGSGTSFSFTPTLNGTYDITLTVLDDCGITTTDTWQTTVTGCSMGCQDCTGEEISANNTPSCSVPTVFSINCANTTTFNWSITGGGGSASGSTFTYTPTANGTYTVNVTWVDECGNNLSDDFTFTVSDCVACQDCTSSSINPSNTPSCNNSTTFTILCSNTNTFNWSITGGGGSASGNTFTYTPTADGSYTVTVTFIDECGNNINKTYTFNINDCTSCACTPLLTFDAANCLLNLNYTGSNCNNYDEWFVIRHNNSGCSGGSTSFANGLTSSFPVFLPVSDDTGYEMFISSPTSCNNQLSVCVDVTGCECSDNPFISSSVESANYTLKFRNPLTSIQDRFLLTERSGQLVGIEIESYLERNGIEVQSNIITSPDFGIITPSQSAGYTQGATAQYVELFSVQQGDGTDFTWNITPITDVANHTGAGGTVTASHLDLADFTVTALEKQTAYQSYITNLIIANTGLPITSFELYCAVNETGTSGTIRFFMGHRWGNNSWIGVPEYSNPIFKLTSTGSGLIPNYSNFHATVDLAPLSDSYTSVCGNQITKSYDVNQSSISLAFVPAYPFTLQQFDDLDVSLGQSIGHDIIPSNNNVRGTGSTANPTMVCLEYTLVIQNECAGATYLWSTGETTESIIVSSGTYSCDITCPDGCMYNVQITI